MKRFVAFMLTFIIIFSSLIIDVSALTAPANPVHYKFDLGGRGTASGYIGVSATEGYSRSKGYGFANLNTVKNVNSSGTGAYNDAVEFNTNGSNHFFSVDLPSGVYKITVTTGDVEATTIEAEGYEQLIFLTGNNATDSFTIPVTDGQLNIHAASGVGGKYSISALEILQVSTGTTTKPTIWVSGDATVASYYNKPQSSYWGWGQFLNEYVDLNQYDVRNISLDGVTSAYALSSLLPTVEHYGKSGDIYLISVGITDYLDQYALHPNNPSAIDSTNYIANVTALVRRAKAKGMTVYLVKQQGELDDCGSGVQIDSKWFHDEIDMIAASEHVGVIDLFSNWLSFCKEQTRTVASRYYFNNTQPNYQGAHLIAEMVAGLLFPGSRPTAAPTPLPTPTQVPGYVSSARTTETFVTEVSGGPIANPHKGYVMTAYSPWDFDSRNPLGIGGSGNNRAWDVCTICCGSPYWEDLNPAEGVYDWSSIDAVLEQCELHGMTYGIRVIPYSSSIGNDDNYGAAHDLVPDWVYEKGAGHTLATYRWVENSPELLLPDWSDRTYIQACKDFATAMAAKYDGDPRVEFIDIRPFGDWGEWHTSAYLGSEMPSEEIQIELLDHYASVFHNTLLCVPSDASGAVYEHALSIGITKRNDGMIMLPGAELDLIPTYEANLPTVAENHNTYATMLQQTDVIPGGYLRWTQDRFRNVIETAHLSIYALDQASDCGYQFYTEQKAVIDEMCNRLGYNFTVTSAVRYDNKLVITVKNTGLAPSFFDINLCAEVTDANGNKIRNFGNPVLISSGTFRDGTERTFTFDYSGTLGANEKICLAMYDVNNPLTNSRPTVKFDNKNNLSNNRLMLVRQSITTNTNSNPTPTNNPTPTTKPTNTSRPTATPSAHPTLPPFTPDRNSTGVEGFVNRLYTVVLGRTPDRDGKQFYIDLLTSYQLSGGDAAKQMLLSQEFTKKNYSNSDFVEILYRLFYNRNSDSEGKQFWVNQLNSGKSREVIITAFMSVPEWERTCVAYGIETGIPGVEGFVSRMYTVGLNRIGDASGKDYYINLLRRHVMTGGDAAQEILLSQEFKNRRLNDTQFLEVLYRMFYGRKADTPGLNYWLGRMRSGMTREQVITDFIRSTEWSKVCGSYGILSGR